MRKRPVIITLVIVLVLGGAGWLYSRTQVTELQDERRFVTDEAGKGEVTATVSDSGHLEPEESRTVRAKTSGTVEEIPISEGQSAQRGDRILQMESEELRSRLEHSRLDLEEAKLSLRDLLDLQPDAPLPDDLMRDTLIEAPAKGRIHNLAVEEGERVSSGTMVADIHDDERARVEVGVTPDRVEQIAEGDEATVYLNAFAGSKTGRVSEVDAEPRPMDGVALCVITVVIDNPRGLIEPGHSASVHFPEGFQRDGEVINPPTTQVRADISGEVEKLAVQNGDTVDEGTTIMTLASPSHSVSINEQLNRIRSAELSVAEDERAVDDLSVNSPIEGILTDIEVKEGDEISSGTSVMTVSSHEAFYLTMEVDELDIASVEPGQRADVEVDALKKDRVTGEVVSISGTPSDQNGAAAYPVDVRVPAHDGMMEGMSAAAEIEVDRRSDVIVVPAEAVVTADGISTIEVMTDEGVETREVDTGLSDGTQTEIESGVEKGEEVVLARAHDDRDMEMYHTPYEPDG